MEIIYYGELNVYVDALLLPIQTGLNYRVKMGSCRHSVQHTATKEEAIEACHYNLDMKDLVVRNNSVLQQWHDIEIELIQMDKVIHQQRCMLLPRPTHQLMPLTQVHTMRLYKQWLKKSMPISKTYMGNDVLLSETYGLTAQKTGGIVNVTHIKPWCVFIKRVNK